MARGRFPGELEQIVLLALAGAEGEASGRDVYEAVTSLTGREVSVAAVHITLGRLHEKGWATCVTRSPQPHEGGKPRRRYALAPAGAETLAELRAQTERLWSRALTNPLFGDAGR